MNVPAQEHWFVAILVFESSIHAEKDGPKIKTYDPSVDLQYRLVCATDLESACERAFVMGHEGEHAYENSDGNICAWSFKGLKDLEEVLDDELVDGVEIYGYITEGRAEDYVDSKWRLRLFLGE